MTVFMFYRVHIVTSLYIRIGGRCRGIPSLVTAALCNTCKLFAYQQIFSRAGVSRSTPRGGVCIVLLIGAHTGIRTQTLRILSPLSLPIGLCGHMKRVASLNLLGSPFVWPKFFVHLVGNVASLNRFASWVRGSTSLSSLTQDWAHLRKYGNCHS